MSHASSPNTVKRLRNAAAILQTLDHRRIVTGDPNLGSNIERLVIARELKELEDEIGRNPGALSRHVRSWE